MKRDRAIEIHSLRRRYTSARKNHQCTGPITYRLTMAMVEQLRRETRDEKRKQS